MVIYLKHPVHGTKVAMAELEAEQDEKNGWMRYTPGEQAPVNELRRRRKESERTETPPQGV